MNINWNQVGALVGAQFSVDLRHPKSGKVRSSRVMMTVISYAFSSLVLAFSLRQQAVPVDVALFYALNFGILVVLFAIVSGHQSLMGYPKDFNWIRVLPATEATHYAARLGNMMAFFAIIFVSILVPFGLLYYPITRPEVLTGLLLTLALGMVWIALVGVALFWLFALSVTPRWIKMVTATFQGAIVLMLVIGYQWVGSMSLEIPSMPWWPATWFVDIFAGRLTAGTAVAGASILILAASLVTYYPKNYYRILERLAAAEEDKAPTTDRDFRSGGIENFFIRDPQILGVYRFAITKFMHDATVRDRLWPIIMLPLAFAFFGWWTGSLNNLFDYAGKNILLEPGTRMHPSLLIILFFSCQSLLQSIQFSSHPEASWVYRAAPLKSFRTAQIAAHHALNYRVLTVLFAGLWAILSLSIPPFHGLIHIAFWWTTCLFVMRLQLFFHKEEPFSRKSDRFAISERFLPLLIAVPLAIVFTAMQVLVFYSEWVALLFIATMALINHGIISVRR